MPYLPIATDLQLKNCYSGNVKMKRTIKTIILLAAVTAICGIFSGCTVQESHRKKQYKYPVELMPSQDAYVKKAGIYTQDGQYILQGKVKRSVKSCCSAISGHVDMILIAEDGSVIDMFTAGISPSNIPKTAAKQSSFKVELAHLPPKGSTIKARFHGKKFLSGSGEDLMEDCQRNMLSMLDNRTETGFYTL